MHDSTVDLDTITTLHTLGPEGTNCEAAALEWFRRRDKVGEVVLHATLERAVSTMPAKPGHALLACVVYPDLHSLVFSNLTMLQLSECFVYPTFNMLLASRTGELPRTVSSHPAPRKLIPEACEVRETSSNAQAALDCFNGLTEGCITTLPAARRLNLKTVTDYGPVPMGFTIHTVRGLGVRQ